MSETNVAHAIDLLKHQPSADVIQKCLHMFGEDRPLNLESAAAVVKYVIPIFPSLPRIVRKDLLELFESEFNLVTHTINLIDMLRSKPEAKIYKEFLLEALEEKPSALNNYIGQSRNALEIQIIKSAFFGSKILNCLGKDVDILSFVQMLRSQIEYIFDNVENLSPKLYADFLTSFLSLHESFCLDLLFGGVVLAGPKRFQKWLQMFHGGSVLCRTRLFRSLAKYLDTITTSKSAPSIYTLLKAMGKIDIPYNYLMDLKSPLLKSIMIRIMEESEQLSLYRYLMGFFGKRDFPDDASTCILLAIIFDYLPSHERLRVSSDSSFLDAVTTRLSSQDSVIRERTMWLAKQVTDGGLEFESDFKITIPEFEVPETDVIDYGLLERSRSNQATTSLPLESANEMKIADLTLSESHEDADGYNIVFLKDLVREFEREEKNGSNRIHLLQTTVRLVRQKKDFALEVNTYSSQLLTIICLLNNSLDEPQFQEWKVNALVSILVTTPEKVVQLVKILFEQELSLQQRITILSVMSLSARELRGIDDNFILKPQTDFPTERLSWDQSKRESITGGGTQQKVLSNNQTVWRSKKLDKASDNNTRLENRFQRVAPKFFYPLAHGWLNGIDMGAYDVMFKKHYLSTMQIILSAAHPHHEIHSMFTLMGSVLESAHKDGFPFDEMDLSKLSELAKKLESV
ncbi:LAFA_0D12948g1_1 [Lachancea sp. 'fantastica']|nr:LAFA_0D12948g1_1 [Lachancea sp. 'fantastica']